MSVREGFEKAVSYLRSVLIAQPAGEAWWYLIIRDKHDFSNTEAAARDEKTRAVSRISR